MEQRCKGVRKVWAQSDALKLGTEFSEGDLKATLAVFILINMPNRQPLAYMKQAASLLISTLPISATDGRRAMTA